MLCLDSSLSFSLWRELSNISLQANLKGRNGGVLKKKKKKKKKKKQKKKEDAELTKPGGFALA